MRFSSVVGQENLKEKLRQTIRSKRISHAQLFIGPAGYGSVLLAIAYAQYICCENRTDNDSCGVCRSCIKYEKLIHPDLHFAFPVNSTKTVTADKKPISDHFIADWRKKILETAYFTEQEWYETIGIENKQGNITVNEADKVIGKLSLKPYEAEYKVMIIWLPERMNTPSANRLLKLIEEPPQKTLFFFVTENEENVLKTIYSRTQRIKLVPLEENEIFRALKEREEASERDLIDAAHLSRGNIIDAREILRNSENKSDFFESFVTFMRLAYMNDIIGLLTWAEGMATIGRERQKSFFSYAQRMVRENFILNKQLEDLVYLANDEKEWARKFSAFISSDNVFLLYRRLNECIPQIGQNGNAKIIFTDLALKVKELIRPMRK